MAADVTQVGGVAVQASSGGVWAVVGSTVALVSGYVLKTLTDNSTRALQAQAQSHAGEKATLLTLYGNLEQRYGQLETKYAKLAEEVAGLRTSFDLSERTNKALVERLARRELRIKELADELTITRQERVADKQAKFAAEAEAQALRAEVNTLLVAVGQAAKYPVTA